MDQKRIDACYHMISTLRHICQVYRFVLYDNVLNAAV